jgi:hypothetical protein
MSRTQHLKGDADMGNHGSGAPNGHSQGAYGSYNPAVGVEQLMLVVANNSDLREFVSMQFDQMRYMVDANGGRMDLELDEFIKYVVTGYKVRVEYVTKGTWRALGYRETGMHPKDRWAMPVPSHDAISSVGKTNLGTAGAQIIPVWDRESDELVLTREQRDVVTLKLNTLTQRFGIPTASTLSTDMDGHHQVMILTYLPQREEWWAHEVFGREDAAASMVAGLRPVTVVEATKGGPEFAIVDTDQLASDLSSLSLWVPPLKLDKTTVIRYNVEMANLQK